LQRTDSYDGAGWLAVDGEQRMEIRVERNADASLGPAALENVPVISLAHADVR
jgi:hypothetical protein